MKWMLMILLLIISCDETEGPEARLKSYLNLRLKGGHDKEAVMEFLTGEIREDIAKMGEEEFNQFRSLNLNVVKDIDVIQKRCRDDACFLTYTFKYAKSVFDSPPAQKDAVEVEIKKIAKLEMVNEKWRISSIDNMKSFIKFNKAIDIQQ